MRSTKLAFIALVATVALLAPQAAAQQPNLSIEFTQRADQIQPEVTGEEMTINFKYQLPQNVYTQAGNFQSFATVPVSFDCDPGISVEGTASVIIPIDTSKTEANHEEEASFTISATKDAKGLSLNQCTITAQAQEIQAQSVPASNTVTQAFSVDVGYYDSLSVNVPTPIQRAAPQKEVVFTLSITNFGNADTRVLFSYADEQGVPDSEKYDWNAILPTAQVVPTKIGEQNNVLDVTFTVTTPARTGWNNILDGYTIVISPQADVLSSAKGTPVTASVLVRVRGVYVPGFEALGLLGALIGAGLVIRRRQQE